MKKFLSITAIAFLSFAGVAHAATLITLGSTNTDISYSIGGALNPNVSLNSLSPAQLTLTGDALLVPGAISLGGQYRAPDAGSVFGGSYLAVIATPTPSGFATYSLGPNQNSLGFTWGSVDTYNTLTITATNATYTITGSDLGSHISGVSFGTSDEDLLFKDTAGTILSVSFGSTQNSFEVANFKSAVPLPAALPLFGSALLGFALLARRRKAAIS